MRNRPLLQILCSLLALLGLGSMHLSGLTPPTDDFCNCGIDCACDPQSSCMEAPVATLDLCAPPGSATAKAPTLSAYFPSCLAPAIARADVFAPAPAPRAPPPLPCQTRRLALLAQFRI